MKKIRIALFLLMMISNLSFANNDIRNKCKEFSGNIEKSAISLDFKKNILFESGVLWKVTTPNKKINYLFGTMHAQDYSVSRYPPEVRLALVNSKKLILEIIPSNQENIAYIDKMYLKNGKQLNHILEDVFFKQLKEQIKNYSLSDEEFKNIKYLKPWAAFNLIGRPKTVNAPTLESNLLKLAKQRMLHIDSLESMDEVISSLEKLSNNDQLNILRDTICNHKSIIKETKILVDLYAQRDILGILNFNNKKYFDEDLYKRYMQLMLYDRNKKMLHKIINEFKDGGIFVAVGILHLISEQGLLEELSNQEYKLKVIY